MELNSLLFKKSVDKKSIEKDLRKIPDYIIPHIFEHIENLVKEQVSPGSYKLAGSQKFFTAFASVRMKAGKAGISKMGPKRNSLENKYL